MSKHLITAAVIGLLAGLANSSEADTLYDACHKTLAIGGTVVLSEDGKTFTYTTCDKLDRQTYGVDGYSFARGKPCMKPETPKISCKGSKHSCGSPLPDPETYVPSCLSKPQKLPPGTHKNPLPIIIPEPPA